MNEQIQIEADGDTVEVKHGETDHFQRRDGAGNSWRTEDTDAAAGEAAAR